MDNSGMTKSYAGQVLTKLVDDDPILTYYKVAQATGMDQSTVSRIANGTIKDPKVSQLRKLASGLKMDIIDFIEPRITKKTSQSALPETIQTFVQFYYVDRKQAFRLDQPTNKIGQAVKKQYETGLKAFLKDLDALTHNPGSAELILNKIQSRAYSLVSDKEKHDPVKVK